MNPGAQLSADNRTSFTLNNIPPYNNPQTARTPHHEYESIDDEVVKSGDAVIAAVTDETPIVAGTGNSLQVEDQEEEVVVSRNPAYAAVEGEEENTGYENMVTPWRHYVAYAEHDSKLNHS